MAIPTQTMLQGTSKVTRPTQSLLAGAPYVPSHQTDIRKTFAMEQARVAAFYQPHQNLPLPMSAEQRAEYWRAANRWKP